MIVKKRTFKTCYDEECIRNVDFNEDTNTISKLLNFLNFDVTHTAVKINENEIHICKDQRGNLNQDYDLEDGCSIELFLLPDSYDFYLPTLSFFSDGEIHKMSDLKEFNKNFFNFPIEVLNKKTCGNDGEGDIAHIQRSEGAIRNLKDNGFLESSPGSGNYKITEKGLQFYNEHEGKIFRSELAKYIFVKSDSNFKHNLIYFGAPGTGKSHELNKQKCCLLTDEFKENYERVTFHPDYSYAAFVGTYKPVPIENEIQSNDVENDKKSSISYDYVPGPFMRLLVDALKNPQEPFLLIIEEINRANVAAVFGDVFQLLDRRSDGEHLKYTSKFPIHTTNDMKKYLIDELSEVKDSDEGKERYLNDALGENFDKIIIPKNMYIWATMNSADQGVFPMDTAFKRRWDFEYLDINAGKEKIENIKINGELPDSWKTFKDNKDSWNEIRMAINNELLHLEINEDKLMGPFFAFNEYIGQDKELMFDEFNRIFKNKILMYLIEDAAKLRKNKLFEGVEENSTYSQICKKFDEKGFEIFSGNIQSALVD